jgi:hypothetical protein
MTLKVKFKVIELSNWNNLGVVQPISMNFFRLVRLEEDYLVAERRPDIP